MRKQQAINETKNIMRCEIPLNNGFEYPMSIRLILERNIFVTISNYSNSMSCPSSSLTKKSGKGVASGVARYSDRSVFPDLIIVLSSTHILPVNFLEF